MTVKLTMMVHRKKGMSEEDFHQHWTTAHPKVVNDWLQKYGITRYVQYHTTSSMRKQAQEELKSFGDMIQQNMLDYDGIVEFLMPSFKCFDDARKDPYYESHVKPDEDLFFDMSTAVMIVGYEEQKF